MNEDETGTARLHWFELLSSIDALKRNADQLLEKLGDDPDGLAGLNAWDAMEKTEKLRFLGKIEYEFNEGQMALERICDQSDLYLDLDLKDLDPEDYTRDFE